MQDLIIRQDVLGITTLTLNRPMNYNALSFEMISELQKMLDNIKNDKRIRVVIMTGSGNGFCAGHDLKEMMANRNKKFITKLFKACSKMMLTLKQIPQPVIAKVDGIATAAGCQLVASCDLAVASLNSKFATSGIKFGLFCSTPSVPLSRNVLRKHAFEMLFTGEFINAEKAAAIGLINYAVEAEKLNETVIRIADSIMSKPRKVIAAGKKVFYKQLEVSIEKAYEIATKCLTENMLGDDAAEGVTAFIEKRQPKWDE
jgi:enoyl-CoA hydratase/carnithine racemase